MSEIDFMDAIQGAEVTVAEIKESESPDLIVCLSHSGGDPKVSEDELLAAAVPIST